MRYHQGLDEFRLCCRFFYLVCKCVVGCKCLVNKYLSHGMCLSACACIRKRRCISSLRMCGWYGISGSRVDELVFLFLLLTLKAPSKIAADDTFIIFTFYLSKKIRLDISWEPSAKQRIHMKYQALFYQKNNEKIFKAVICCSRDWRFKG